MSKIELTEQELHFMVFDLWMDKNIMNPINLGKVLKDKIKKHQAKHNEVLDIVSKPLKVNALTVNPIDSDGDIEIESGGYSSYLTTNEAKELIEYLQTQINAC